MKFLNFNINIFSSNNTTNQENNIEESDIIVNTDGIDENFNTGNISTAFEELNSNISKITKKTSKYPLLIKKVKFLLETRDIEKAKSVIALLSKDYDDFIDIKYKEQLLLIYSLEKKEKNFFELVEEIKAEKDDVKKDEYFQILYHANSNNLEEALNIFNSYTPYEQEENYVIGGHIFSNLYNMTKDKAYLEKSNSFYTKVLENDPSFLMKVHVNGFFVNNIITQVIQTSNTNIDKTQIMEQKVLLNKLFKSKKYFNNQYINQLINFYAFILLVLEFKDEYIQFYENHSNILFNEHCFQYWHFKNKKIDHKQVQDNIHGNSTLLINYASLMTDKDKETIIVNYFEKNHTLILKYDLLVYFYIKAVTKFKHKIVPEIKSYITDNKSNSYELYSSYLLLKYDSQESVSQDEVEMLLTYLKDEDLLYSKVIETIDFLEKIKKSEIYIKFAMTKITLFAELTKFVFNKCWHDRELKLKDFELFLSSIDTLKYAPYIADIYFKYDRYDKSFEYFNKMWDEEHNIDNAVNLLRIGVNNFQKFNSRIDEEIENEALFYLQSVQKELDFNNIGLISFYSLIINKDKNNAFGIINKKVLEINVYELDNSSKEQLSSLYFNSLVNFKDKELDTFERNTVFIKEGIYYLDKTVFKNINEVYIDKFNIALVDKIEMKKMEENENFEKKSLFHFLVNQILETIDSPHFKMIKVDLSSSSPLEEMQEMMITQSKHIEGQFERYSKGEDIAFWNLADTYDKYFNLIVKLLEDETINFNSCRINYQPKEVPKLLTLSSIIFLNYNNKLEEILERQDVFIQKTTYDWLIKYVDELDKQDEIFSAFAKDGKFFKDIVSKEQIEQFSSALKGILNNIKYKQIVDDTKASLPFKNAFSLSKHFGIQEYQALALSYQQNYQIITEDRMFEVIFKILNFNLTMISNSLCLFNDNDLHELRMKLHQKNYKFVLHLNSLIQLVNVLTERKINRFSEKATEIINILNDYGLLENIIRVYKNTYKVLYPKMNIPQEDYVSKNIEKMLECLNNK